MDVVEHGETAFRRLRVEGADAVPFPFVKVPELGIARVGIVSKFLSAYAIADLRPRSQSVNPDTMQPMEDTATRIGLPDLGPICQFDIGHPGFVAGPQDGHPVRPHFRHPRSGMDTLGEAVQAERNAQ